MIKKKLVISWDELLVAAGVSLIGGIAGFILVHIINNMEPAESAAGIMTLMSSIIGIAFLLFIRVYTSSFDFILMVGMGRTRKEFFVSQIVMNLLCFLSAELVSVMVFKYEQFTNEGFMQNFHLFIPGLLVVTVFCLSAVSMICGAFITRFGRKAYVALWLIWMFLCLMPSGIEKRIEKNPNAPLAVFAQKLIHKMMNLGIVKWLILAMCLAVVLYVISYFIYRNQEV